MRIGTVIIAAKYCQAAIIGSTQTLLLASDTVYTRNRLGAERFV
jgi:hypothetical protein